MKFVTTNIRLPEEDWEAFKLKALKERKSLSAWIRDSLKKGKGEIVAEKAASYQKDSFWEFPKLLKKLKVKDRAPKDLAENLDNYLYGQE